MEAVAFGIERHLAGGGESLHERDKAPPGLDPAVRR
jgi:hypothetical protein